MDGGDTQTHFVASRPAEGRTLDALITLARNPHRWATWRQGRELLKWHGFTAFEVEMFIQWLEDGGFGAKLTTLLWRTEKWQGDKE